MTTRLCTSATIGVSFLVHSATALQGIAPFTSHVLSPISPSSHRNAHHVNIKGTSSRSFRLNLRNNKYDEDDLFEFSAAAGSLPESSFGSENVPEGQRPANEYLDLIRQPLFNWCDESKGNTGFILRLVALYGVTFGLLGYPIAGETFAEEGFLLQKIAAANVGSLLVVMAVLIRLYSGWGYVASRLQSNEIEYEETGWYDGSFEEKSTDEKARDLFLYRNDVKPVVDRAKQFCLGVAVLWLISTAGFVTAVKSKPIFNEYDAELLKALPYDDKLANIASRQSNGRPTYCDSRYYRAVANGGKGCN